MSHDSSAPGRNVSIVISREPISSLREYGRISSAFTVDHRYVRGSGTGGLAGLDLEPVESPFVKDYDRDNGHGPASWPERWSSADWGVFGAFDGSTRIGGALVGSNTPGAELIAGREDTTAVLWDLRVAPCERGRGVGASLFGAVLQWSRERDLTALVAETQDVNVAACRFYARNGCRLTAINPFAYPDFPGEVQFIWSLELR